MSIENLLTVDEAAAVLSISKRTLYEWIELGLIAHCKFGRLVRLRTEDLETFIAAGRREARPVLQHFKAN